MTDLEKEHEKKFGVNAVIIGLLLDEPLEVDKNIEKAIKDNKPYNEYELLSDSEKKAFDSGSLVF